MEKIFEELKKKWPSKVVLRNELEKIRVQFNMVGKSDINDFDETIRFFMTVRTKGKMDTWNEEILEAHRLKNNEEEIVKWAKDTMDDFNRTLRQWDEPRELVGVFKEVVYNKKTKLF